MSTAAAAWSWDAKAEQYVRWRELRKLQEQNDKKSANAASPTSH